MAAFDFGLDDLFGDNREGRNLIFQTFLDRFKQPGIVTDFNRPGFSQFGNQANNEFLGATGRAIQQGQDAPTFTDFLNNDFNLGRRARRAPSSQLGTGTSRFASPARFLFNS